MAGHASEEESRPAPDRSAKGRDTAAAGPPRRVRGQRWLQTYFAVAGLYLLTVLVSVYLHRELLGLHAETIEIDRRLADRVENFNLLGRLADEIAAPANEVFISQDFAAAQAKMEAAFAPYGEHLEKVRDELQDALEDSPDRLRSQAIRSLLDDLDLFTVAVDGVIGQAERTFSFFRTGDTQYAGVRAGEMNRQTKIVDDALVRLIQGANEQVRLRLAEQIRKGEQLARAERVVLAVVGLFVLALALYGVRLWQTLRRDAAARERELAELAESEAHKTAILTSALDCILAMDHMGRIREFNPAAESTFGYTRDEAIGSNIFDVVGPESMAEIQQAEVVRVGPGREGLAGRRGETLAQRRDGTKFPVAFSITSYELNGRGAFTAYVRDITEEKHLEAQREAAERDLRRAKDAAEAATRAKSEFLANMSHEIRTPMNAVVGMTGLLLDTPLTDEQREFVETVRSSSDALLTIINDILDFSKIESGKLELEKQPFDVRDCVEEALDLVALRAGEKHLELAYEIEDGVPGAIFGDVTRLRQILVNLLSNAVKFTEEGEVTVRVEGGRASAADPSVTRATGNGSGGLVGRRHQIHIVVSDTGIGIPPEKMDRLFRSFSQVDASTTRQYGGTGLGLAISKRLAELMGGTMWAESELGRGSRFHVTLAAETAPAQRRVHAGGVHQSLRGLSVLIVDDNATNRRILSLQTASWGMRPQLASSGAEALQALDDGARPDLAILDMCMPEMDGAELARELRRRLGDAPPLILLSSVGRPDHGERSLFSAALSKPIKPSYLFDALISCVDAVPSSAKAVPRKTDRIDSTLGQQRPLRILLAEDNVVNQKVALRILQRMGYRADVAANGLEVLEALARQTYDVVLLDVQMPEMDGLEAARRIVELWPEQRPRLVAMTANAMEGDREACLQAGMDDYVAKPVQIAALQAALERCPTSSSGTVAAAGA